MFANTNTGAQQQQPAQTNLFGNTTAQPSNLAPSLFVNPVSQPAQSNPAQPSLFGATSTNNPTAFNTNQAGGSPFGAPSTQGTAGTNYNPLFGGSTTQQPGNLFGNPPPTLNQGGGIFGATQQQQLQQQQPQAPSTATTGNIFGGGAGAFNTTGPGLFGSKPSGNPFGNLNTGAGNAPNPPFGSIGQPQTQPTNPGIFGQQSQQQQRPLFGTSLNQPYGITFGGVYNPLTASATQNSLFSSRITGLPSQQRDVQTLFTALVQRIESIAQSWNANSPLCRFQHYFYNLVDPSQVSLYVRPPNATNDALWEKAVRENPDPTCFVPVLAVGFDDLQQRINAQSQQATAHQEKIKDLKARIAALTQRHEVSNASRMQRAAKQQAQFAHRVLTLVQHLHLLIPTLRSSAIRPEEEALRAALEEIDEEMRRPGGRGRMPGKLNELWALLGAVHAAKERGRKGVGGSPGNGVDNNVEWAVVDEEGLAQIAQILSEQQAGLAHVTKILQRDLKDLSIIQGDGSAGPEDEPPNLSRTLRLSSLR